MNDWQQSSKRNRNNNTPSPQWLTGHRTVCNFLRTDSSWHKLLRSQITKEMIQRFPFLTWGNKTQVCILIADGCLLLCANERFLSDQHPAFAEQKLMVVHWLSSLNGHQPTTSPINPPISLLFSIPANPLLWTGIYQAFPDARDVKTLVRAS